MGESEDTSSFASAQLDDNIVLPAIRYTEFQEAALRDYTLADAIACSASVPGFFQPMIIPGFSAQKNSKSGAEKQMVVKIVDGGMVDNYGMCFAHHGAR